MSMIAASTSSTSLGLMQSVAPNCRASSNFSLVSVDRDDAIGARHHRALDHREPDPAEAEDRHARTRLDLRRVQDGADARGDAAAEQADLLERRVLADLRQRDLGHHGVFGERRRAHVVMARLALRSGSGSSRRASGPGPGSRGSPGRGSSCPRDRTCTADTRACTAGSRDRPAASDVTPAPTSTTSPAPSCPSTAGNRPSGSSPQSVKASVWQTPVAASRTRHSPAFGPSRSISSMTSGLPASTATAALDFIFLRSLLADVRGCPPLSASRLTRRRSRRG